jgi:Rrf2 family protein
VSSLAPARLVLAVAAVVDVALHARPAPVSARALAARHALPPRHLEPLLQALVHHGVLKGVRGPRGGYELARERRRISAGEVARAALAAERPAPVELAARSALVTTVVEPAAEAATAAFLAALDAVSIDDLCRRAEAAEVFGPREAGGDFAI